MSALLFSVFNWTWTWENQNNWLHKDSSIVFLLVWNMLATDSDSELFLILYMNIVIINILLIFIIIIINCNIIIIIIINCKLLIIKLLIINDSPY